MFRIEALLSARQFVAPEPVGDRIYFISNISGHFSLYVMDRGGSVPEPLLPPDIALQNPELMNGYSFRVFPKLGKILVMIDHHGDEKYQPMFIPLEGGFPEPVFPELEGTQVFAYPADVEANMAYLVVSSLTEAVVKSYRADLEARTLEELGQSDSIIWAVAAARDHSKAILIEGYSAGDNVVYLHEKGRPSLQLLHGVPMKERKEGQVVPPSAINNIQFSPSEAGLVFTSALFEDTYSLGYLLLEQPGEVKPVQVTGTVHEGLGEMTDLRHLQGDRYLVQYNIDGCSWAYEGTFDERNLTLDLDNVLCGQGRLSNGVVDGLEYDKENDRYALSFSTAASPTQLYTIEGPGHREIVQHTRERILGVPDEYMSLGEDASFRSFDGEEISARLYMPSASLGFDGPRPLVYYIHGGPQGQERPNFAWFSMPLIQFLTLNGFAVFVPNVRGSTGYGLKYMKHVDNDWGGKDRLDHVHAMTEVLPKDPRIDTKRAGVIGRSYGGYMTLTLATRHPELWSAAVDMFGPYSLITFIERMPSTWKPYFYKIMGNPTVPAERDFLLERSPYSYIGQLKCPMLVIQGANDPRVIEQESRDVVEHLKERGTEAELLVFGNEGHDVIKFENKVVCYNRITEFFKEHLKP